MKGVEIKLLRMGDLSVNHNPTQIFEVSNDPFSMSEKKGCSVFHMLPILQHLSLVVYENGEK